MRRAFLTSNDQGPKLPESISVNRDTGQIENKLGTDWLFNRLRI